MHAIDTNVLLRLVLRDDDLQVTRAESFVAGGAWVSHIVLAEAVWVLVSTYKLRREQVENIIDALLEGEKVQLQAPVVVAAALGHFRSHRSVEFSDCLIFEIARSHGHEPCGTFDKAFARIKGVKRL